MPNPTYEIRSEDGDFVMVAQTFDLTQPACPAVIIDLRTMLQRFDVQSVTRLIRMRRREADSLGIGYAGG